MLGILLLPAIYVPQETTAATDPSWRPVKTTRAGSIYHRSDGISAFPWVMIATRFEAAPSRVHALVTDYDRFAEFIPNLATSRIVRAEGGEQWVLHHLRFPAPVADRVYVIVTADAGSLPQQHYYQVTWRLTERAPPGIELPQGRWPEAFSGYWELRPGARPGTTEARYALNIDPGGYLPGWLVGTMTDRYVQQVVEAIRERLNHAGPTE